MVYRTLGEGESVFAWGQQLRNADTALIARTLWSDATVRDAVVAQAQAVATGGGGQPCPAGEDASTCLADRLRAVQALGRPLGWPDLRFSRWGSERYADQYADDERVPHNWAEGFLKLFGLLLTAAALAASARRAVLVRRAQQDHERASIRPSAALHAGVLCGRGRDGGARSVGLLTLEDGEILSKAIRDARPEPPPPAPKPSLGGALFQVATSRDGD